MPHQFRRFALAASMTYNISKVLLQFQGFGGGAVFCRIGLEILTPQVEGCIERMGDGLKNPRVSSGIKRSRKYSKLSCLMFASRSGQGCVHMSLYDILQHFADTKNRCKPQM